MFVGAEVGEGGGGGVDTPYSTLSVGPTIPQSLATLTAVNMLSPDEKSPVKICQNSSICHSKQNVQCDTQVITNLILLHYNKSCRPVAVK